MTDDKQHLCPGCDGPTTGDDLPCSVFCIQRARDRMEHNRAIVAQAQASICGQELHNGPTGLWLCQRDKDHAGPCWEVGWVDVDAAQDWTTGGAS